MKMQERDQFTCMGLKRLRCMCRVRSVEQKRQDIDRVCVSEKRSERNCWKILKSFGHLKYMGRGRVTKKKYDWEVVDESGRGRSSSVVGWVQRTPGQRIGKIFGESISNSLNVRHMIEHTFEANNRELTSVNRATLLFFDQWRISTQDGPC